MATFYDMFSTVPKPRNDVYVCTNISCSLRGADEFFEAMQAAAEGDPDVNVRSFECLGACDIAPMASVNGEYVGPLELDDAERIVEDLRAGRTVLEHKQLRYRRCADPGVAEERRTSARRTVRRPRWPTLPASGPRATPSTGPGPTAAIEMTTESKPSSPSPRRPPTRISTPPARNPTKRGTANEDPVRPDRRARPEHARGLRAPRRL